METLSSIIQVLQLNQTFFIYLVVFFIFLIITEKLLLAPAFKRFLKQESLTTGQVVQSQTLQEENEKLKKQYEQTLIQYNQKLQEILNQKRNQLLQQQQQQVAHVQKEVQEFITQSKTSLNKEYQQTRQQLFEHVPQLAQTLLSRINA